MTVVTDGRELYGYFDTQIHSESEQMIPLYSVHVKRFGHGASWLHFSYPSWSIFDRWLLFVQQDTIAPTVKSLVGKVNHMFLVSGSLSVCGQDGTGNNSLVAPE